MFHNKYTQSISLALTRCMNAYLIPCYGFVSVNRMNYLPV